jgi:hypothetical protein
MDAFARSFASTVQGFEAKANVKIATIRARVEALTAATQQYVAKVGAERERVGAETEVARAQASIFGEDIQRYSAELTHSTQLAQLDVTKLEARLRNNLAFYEIQVKEFDAGLTRLIQEMTLRVEGLKTIATTTSQLAAGAFAAMHVSAGMQGNANASDSFSQQYVHNFNETPT